MICRTMNLREAAYHEVPLISIHTELANNINKLEKYKEYIEKYHSYPNIIESKLKELNNILKNETEKEN